MTSLFTIQHSGTQSYIQSITQVICGPPNMPPHNSFTHTLSYLGEARSLMSQMGIISYSRQDIKPLGYTSLLMCVIEI